MAAAKGTAALMVEIALKEEGYVEGPKDNETKYGAFTKANFLPWCGSFCMWVANQSGVTIPNTVSTMAGAAAFKKMGTWTDAEKADPQPGDIVYFDFVAGGAPIEHVGIVVKNNGDGTVTTMEGNTSGDKKKSGSQANGGEAVKKIRAYKRNAKGIPSFIVGFGRPNYKGNEVEVNPAPAVIPPFPGPIKPGAQGDAVKLIQHALTLVEDGDYGPATKKAVVAFQDNHDNLDSNGIVGPKTWDALMKTAL
jgi:peptidoglycan hydrolase-like protein with peptidoglycan-binding domain